MDKILGQRPIVKLISTVLNSLGKYLKSFAQICNEKQVTISPYIGETYIFLQCHDI